MCWDIIVGSAYKPDLILLGKTSRKGYFLRQVFYSEKIIILHYILFYILEPINSMFWI